MTKKDMIKYLKEKEREYYNEMKNREEYCNMLNVDVSKDKMYNFYDGKWIAIYGMMKDLGIE